MKVLQFGKFYPPVIGGIESVMFDLTEGLNTHGVSTDVLCSNKVNHSTTELVSGEYQVYRSASWGQIFSTSISPAMIQKLAKVVKNYDILHVHLPDPMANLAIWLVRPNCKIVLHWHSDIVKQKNLLKLYAPLQEWLLRRADVIIATSSVYLQSSQTLIRHRSKVSIIPIGIKDPASLVNKTILNKFKEKFHAKRIVFSLGRMSYYKGFSYLVDAAKYIEDDTVILIGGSGELFVDLQKQIDGSGVADKVKLLGKIPHEELFSYYSVCDLFCLPSIFKSEAFGVVLLEAMAFSKPVVATKIPDSGVPWVNAHDVSGINVPIMDSVALAKAINSILSSQDLMNRYAASARDRYLSTFTADKMVLSTSKLYEALLGS
ncbi:glycosyltransferase [Iodobacter fluviatilis]|uniref:GDP-mannose-dependent alpha-(1-2)-phosphatidylinositol mannosyltransferase n=1 Tax=Iodobacter fluviatilis TaxID=537 RepID=A0A377SWZ6_9NEIS|nr:glycosyltransferase [Iodobacter fluviatilis]TCU87986.1 rhamnosyl/mannosyltransferase [Iodobacter fluviatilis]STR45487.1 GDP-mannose-dependent alpha-(1-2)-phosphatidylinositol mannosyltransferase [Iodobacter fluviatilis]